ncbi:hypothetical protein V6N13_114441 [Hibiscus sabdariffa]
MFFSPYYLPSLPPQNNPKVCSQNPKNDLFVCLFGCVVVPSKNGVGHSRDDLVRLEAVEGGDDTGSGSRREKVYAKSRRILGSSVSVGCRSVSTSLGTFKFGRYIYIDGNSRTLYPAKVMNQNFKELKEFDRVFSQGPISKVRDGGTWAEPERSPEVDDIKWRRVATAHSETTVEPITVEIRYYSGGYRGEGLLSGISGILSPKISTLSNKLRHALFFSEKWLISFVGSTWKSSMAGNCIWQSLGAFNTHVWTFNLTFGFGHTIVGGTMPWSTNILDASFPILEPLDFGCPAASLSLLVISTLGMVLSLDHLMIFEGWFYYADDFSEGHPHYP